MKKTGLILSLLLVICSCSTGSRRPAQVDLKELPRHVVFLVHGVGGNASHFGHMEEALKYHLNSQGGDRFRYEVVSFEYDTTNDKKDVFEFSKALDQVLATSFAYGISPNDRISFVVHSQGGLIASFWILQAFRKTPGFHFELADHVDSLTTLGTPFWGAKIAGFAAPIKEWANKFRVPLKAGHKQLEDMTFGSDMIYWLRQNIMEPHPFRQVRVLNIGAYVKWLKYIPGALGATVYEDDTAVILPSSHADFYYIKSIKKNYDSVVATMASEFKETNLGQYQVVNAIHLSSVVDLPQASRGIAQIQSACIENLNCDHPVFKNVVEHIRNNRLNWTIDESDKMTSFLLDINVVLPDGNKVNPKEVSVEFDLPKDIEVGRQSELMSHGMSVSKNRNMVRIYYTGIIGEGGVVARRRERKIFLKVRAKGYKQRVFEVPIKAMQSTYIELNLEKS